MTTIKRDSLDQPYAAIDVSVYQPLTSQQQLLNIIVNTMMQIRFDFGIDPGPLAVQWGTDRITAQEKIAALEISLKDAQKAEVAARKAKEAADKGKADPKKGEQAADKGKVEESPEAIEVARIQTEIRTELDVLVRTDAAVLQERRALLQAAVLEHSSSQTSLILSRNNLEKAFNARPPAGSGSRDAQYLRDVGHLLLLKLQKSEKKLARAAEWEEAAKGLHQLLGQAQYLNAGPSNVGVLHRYRQHFIYSELRAGPLEVLQPLAPNESMEVVYTETKTRSWDQIVEKETEVTTSSSEERHDEDELTDRVANTLSKSASSTTSASGGGNWGIAHAEGSHSMTVADSSSKTMEFTARRLSEITRKQAEQIKKRTKMTTRIVETRSESTTSRHVIRNRSQRPVNYGLRRLYYDVNVKLQDLTPLLVWQSLVREPGKLLARSEFLVAKDPATAAPVSREKLYEVQTPGQPEIRDNYFRTYSFDLSSTIKAMTPDELQAQRAGEEIVTIRTTSLIVRAGLDINKYENVAHTVISATLDIETGNFNIRVQLGGRSDKWTDAIGKFMCTIHPTKKAVQVYQETVAKDLATKESDRLLRILNFTNQLPREKLEFEERKVLLGSVIASLADSIPLSELDTMLPLLYSNMNELFDLKQMFYDADVAEWGVAKKIRHDERPTTYDLHPDQTKPVPLGSSLNWTQQIDGDDKRNMFLNAEWIKVGIPMRVGREREAAGFLAMYLPGTDDSITRGAVEDIEAIRQAEQIVSRKSLTGEVVVTKCTKVDPCPRAWMGAKPEVIAALDWMDVYPILSEQHVVIPVKGYIHDTIDLESPAGGWKDDGRANGNETYVVAQLVDPLLIT